MNLGIDFHLYKSSNNFAAKEYAIYELNPFNRQISLLEHNIVLPVAQEPPDEYSKDALINIPWPAGNIDQEQMVAIINDYLKISSCVIVRDESIKNFILNLCNVNLSLTKITSLSELGYIEIIPKRNACNYHDTQDSNCVVVNAKNMLSWVIINMIVVIDFIAYHLPNETFALKEFGLWSIAPDKNNTTVTSHYSFKPPYEWSRLPSEYQRTYEAHSKHHGIPWDKGTTPFNAMIPAIVDDLRHVTGIYVTSAKAKVVLTELIGDRKEIAILENLGWFDKNEVIKNTCNLHTGKEKNCAYDNARRMSIWIGINQMIVEASGFDPTVSIMQHVDVNKRN